MCSNNHSNIYKYLIFGRFNKKAILKLGMYVIDNYFRSPTKNREDKPY